MLFLLIEEKYFIEFFEFTNEVFILEIKYKRERHEFIEIDFGSLTIVGHVDEQVGFIRQLTMILKVIVNELISGLIVLVIEVIYKIRLCCPSKVQPSRLVGLPILRPCLH
jgi:hypothetical protein